MAITNSDGSIVLSTKIDTNGIIKGLSNISNKFSALKDKKIAISTLTQAIKDQEYVINSLNKEYATLVAKGKGESEQAQKLKSQIKELTTELKQLKRRRVLSEQNPVFLHLKKRLIKLENLKFLR